MAAARSADKKKPARVAAGPQAQGFARSMGENTGRILRTIFPLSLILLTSFCVSVALWRIPAHAASSESGGESKSRLSEQTVLQAILRKGCPPWILRQDFEQISHLGVPVAQNHSIFEANLSRNLAHQYESSPWVERVRNIRLTYPAQLEVEIDWRRPAARVERIEVLDRHGVVLNLSADSPVLHDIPLISGVPCMHTESGRIVPEKDLIDALELIGVVKEALANSPGNLKVASANHESNGQWRIITDKGPAIYWGFFSEDPPPDEPRTQEKQALLRRRLCESRDPSSLESIKVYDPRAPFTPRTSMSGSTEMGMAQPRPASTVRPHH